MRHQKTLLVFAGPNGSGKSTITQNFACIGSYVNADEIRRILQCDPLHAAQLATATREKLLESGADFTFETVLSTRRNLDLMKRALASGYDVICIYVLTVNPAINVQRIEIRHLLGGHDVPKDKIIDRYHRALALIPELINVCTTLLIYDNSSTQSEGLCKPIVELHDGALKVVPSPIWSEEMISSLLNGSYQPKPQ